MMTAILDAGGRISATYGAIYIATALAWLSMIARVTPRWNDWIGVSLALVGAAVIAPEPRT